MDILLVEDEDLLRGFLDEELAGAGLRVIGAASAKDAVRAAEADSSPRPAVLVTDVHLGASLDGLALAAAARERWPGLGVVVMTGDPGNLAGRPAHDRERCLAKPFAPARLVDAVREPMGRSPR